MAARVQGLADEEIYITDSIYDVEEVQSEINKYRSPRKNQIEGIEEEVNVYKVLIENVGIKQLLLSQTA